MTSELWFVLAGAAVLVVSWVGNFFGWFTSKHGRGLPDGAGPTIQGSQVAPPDAGGPGGHAD